MILVAIILTSIIGSYTGHLDADIFRMGDFKAFYTAGVIVREARGEVHIDLYDLDKQRAIQDEHEIIGPGEMLTAFFNPPAYAWLMAPISKLPYVAALNLWRLISIAVAAISIVILTRKLRLDFNWWDTLTILLISLPGFAIIISGQNTFLFMGLYAFSYLLLTKGHDFTAGTILGLGALKPQLILFLPVILFFQKRWNALLGFGTGVLLIIMGSVSLVGLDGMVDYFNIFTTDAYLDGIQIQAHKMHSFPAFIRLIIGIDINPTYLASFSVIALALVFGYFSKKKSFRYEASGLLSLSILGTLIATPHLFHYDLALLLLPVLVLYSWTHHNRINHIASRNIRLTILALFILIWLSLFISEIIRVQFSVLIMIYLFIIVLMGRQLHHSEYSNKGNH